MVIFNFETYVKTYVLRLLSNQQRLIVTLEASLTEVFSRTKTTSSRIANCQTILLSGLSPSSLSNNKKSTLKKSEVFPL